MSASASGSKVLLGKFDELGEFIPYAGQRGLSISRSKNMVDDGDKLNPNTKSLAGKKSTEISMDAVYRAGANGFMALNDAYESDEEIDVIVIYPDNIVGTAKGIVSAMDEDWADNENGTISMTVTINGAYVVAVDAGA